MPLTQGYSDKTRQQNIEKLIGEGYDPKQAAAIAYDIQRKNKKKKSLRFTTPKTLKLAGIKEITPKEIDKMYKELRSSLTGVVDFIDYYEERLEEVNKWDHIGTIKYIKEEIGYLLDSIRNL